MNPSASVSLRRTRKNWRWLVLILTGTAFVWWLPDLVESRLRLRPLPNGLAWEVQFNGPDNEQDNPAHVTVDNDGQVLLTGTSFGRSQGSWLAKHEGNTGRELWRWTADLTLQSVPVADSNGGIYLAGSQDRGYRPGPPAPPFSGRNTDFAVCKVEGKSGAVEWKSTFDGGLRDTDWAEELVLAADGNPVAAGFTPDDTRYFGCVAKLNAGDGRVLWQHRTRDELWHGSLALVAMQTGHVIFGSSRKSPEPGSSRISFFVTQLDGEDGRPVWTTEFPSEPPESHMLTHLATTPDGDVIAAGYHAKDRGRSLLVARFAGKDGRLLWSREHNAESHETIEATSLVVGSDGEVFIGARSWNGNWTTPVFDRWVLKLSTTDGHRIWVNREGGKPAWRPGRRSSPFAAGEICSTPKLIMSSSEWLVCVSSTWNGTNADVRAQWLSASDGSVIRNLTFDGAARDHDLFRDAALTRSGEVVVALGSSRCPEWIKPLKALRYRITGGVDWSSVHSETNQVDDADPFNYDSVLWRSLRHPQ